MMNEERNVLDDLLDDDGDEDFDAELKGVKNFDRIRSSVSATTNARNSKLDFNKKSIGNNNNEKSSSKTIKNNGNDERSKRSASRESASCNSQYSCDSGSCSCENHSSMNDGDGHHTSHGDDESKNVNHKHEDDKNASDAESNRSYQSFTRSPSLKIKISKNSDSRMVAKSNLAAVENDEKSNRKNNVDDYDEVTGGRKRKYGDDNGNGLKRSRRHVYDYHSHHYRNHNHHTLRSNVKKDTNAKKRDYSFLIKYFFKDSCYFVMKSNNEENIEISKREGVWSTPLPNELKLNSAFAEFRNVILIFSVKESGKFQGFARLSSAAQYDLEPVKWVLPPGVHSCPFGGIFFIDWICRNELPFTQTSHLINAFNDNKPVKIARDGQEIEPKTGEELCRLFPPDNYVDLIPMLKRMKKQTMNRPRKRFNPRGPFREFNDGNNVVTTTARNENHRNKISSYNLPSLQLIKKRHDYNNGNYSNRSTRDDRYNRTMQPTTRNRTSDSNYGSMNGYHSGYRPSGGSGVYHSQQDSHHNSYNGNNRYSQTITLSSSYTSSNSNSHYAHHHHQNMNRNHYHSHYNQQPQHRSYSSQIDNIRQQLHRDHHHHHHSRTTGGLYRDRY